MLTITIEQARRWYEQADSVHDFEHVLRVYRTAEHLAEIENADLEIVRTAALLHDVAGAAPGSEERAGHHITSAIFAGKVLQEAGWMPERIAAVQHCIRGHRFRGSLDEQPQSLEAKIIFDADKLDVLGAIGVARVIAYAALAGSPFYVEPSQTFLTSGKEEPGEPHSAYHEHLFKLRRVKERLFTASARRLAEERHAYIDDYFKRLGAELRGEA
ncbi:MAG: HD domain-containing protein [Anaerolineae bacterium]|nr:HD domain-containing protein [Anaerolineae bacterium]